MVTGEQTQHVQYCVGDSDNTTFKSSISEFVLASFTFKTSSVSSHAKPASPLLLMFARAPDCIQNQNAVCEGQHLLSEF